MYALDGSEPASSCNAATNGVTGILLKGVCSGANKREERLRWIQSHEWGHTNSIAAGNNPNCGTAGHLCAAWEEGRSDFTSYVTNRLELLRSSSGSSSCGPSGGSTCGVGTNDQFYPDDKYPLHECTCDPHDTGNAFAAVYLDLHHEIGWKAATKLVMESLDSEIDDYTEWVDSSTDENDFYHHMLESDIELTEKGWQLVIGQAWKRHDSSTPASSWDWKDQWPDGPTSAYMIYSPTDEEVVTGGPDSYLPSLALDYRTDEDYFFFYGHKNTAYRFETRNLCSGVDTVIDIVHINSGSETTDATNDDCDPGSGLDSCVTFSPTSSGWYAAKVRAYNQASEGCYELAHWSNDDVGDEATGARPMAPSEVPYAGEWEDSGDVDYYKVYVPDSGSGVSLVVYTCEVTADADTEITLFHESDLVNSVDFNDDVTTDVCGQYASKITYNVPAGKAGFYFLKVNEHGNNATGQWQIYAYVVGDDDVGGTGKASALVLSDDAVKGRMVSGHFDSATDEDWFAVSLGDQEHVTFHVTDLESGADTVMSVYDRSLTGYGDVPLKSGTDVTWLREDDDGGVASLASRIHLVAPRAGDYYVRLRPYSSSTLGAYSLYVHRSGILGDSVPAYP